MLWLTDREIAAAERLLALLGRGGEEAKGRPEGRGGAADRVVLLERAQLALSLKRRRVEIFGESLSAEPPFALLLALYVVGDREPAMTVIRIGELAQVMPTTALRWLEVLEREGWIERGSGGGKRRRRGTNSLSARGRAGLDELFGWPG